MWHEARRSEKKVHELMDAARKRSERRALFLAKRRGDPHQSLRLVGTRCRMHHDAAIYQATQDQQGLIPWNGKQTNLIDRFDGRALLDVIREYDPRTRPVREKTEEEEELDELVNFERYRDLIKQRRRGFTDEQGLEDVEQELETRAIAPLSADRQRVLQATSGKGAYAQVAFAYEGEGRDDSQTLDSDDEEEDEDEEVSSSEDSEDDEIENIGKDHGVQRFNWLVHLDRKAKEEEKRQKEAAKGDPAMRKLSRKERRKASQQEREREKEAARLATRTTVYHDPYREPRGSPTYEAYSRSRRDRDRSRSRSPTPSGSRRYDRYSERSRDRDKRRRTRASTPKIEYITEFGIAEGEHGLAGGGVAPPPSPPSQLETLNRHPTGRILEALHVDPAATAAASGALTSEWERTHREVKVPSTSTSSVSAIAKLSKPAPPSSTPSQKTQSGEKKETPQERLKRIMSKQLNKQIKKDTVTEAAKRREQERERQEKLAETRRIAQRKHHSRSDSRSPRRYHRSRSRSPLRSYPRSPSR
ncbi:CLK4-associating serine/arginine rich protein [Marchantia polymorpha subsp. ruderalis]|nr:hypothetical protein MARPO_0012s0107 [Marchantia polymorpha]BBN18519.1 hypothetical protein Mp_8g03140 [Marchantia polymorpha subsp. ruderalis]|eukprot:PTQ46163.1 hypothetical protein MARPO_0012s0107 [Marchantia polymorpha]